VTNNAQQTGIIFQKTLTEYLERKIVPKTVLAPNAPWPSQKKKTLKEKPQPKVEVFNLDYFAETHDELLKPQKRGKGNPSPWNAKKD
jgi:hypothetical protein